MIIIRTISHIHKNGHGKKEENKHKRKKTSKWIKVEVMIWPLAFSLGCVDIMTGSCDHQRIKTDDKDNYIYMNIICQEEFSKDRVISSSVMWHCCYGSPPRTSHKPAASNGGINESRERINHNKWGFFSLQRKNFSPSHTESLFFLSFFLGIFFPRHRVVRANKVTALPPPTGCLLPS